MICPHCGMDTEKIETSRIAVKHDAEGRMLTWTEITEDQDKKQVRKRVDAYTYKPAGEVDVIDQKIFDASDKLVSERLLKHTGGNPAVTDVKV